MTSFRRTATRTTEHISFVASVSTENASAGHTPCRKFLGRLSSAFCFSVADRRAKVPRGRSAALNVSLFPACFAEKHDARPFMRLANKRRQFGMFESVTNGTKNLDIGAIKGFISIHAPGDLVMTVKIFYASALLTLANLSDGALRQIILGASAFCYAPFPAWMFWPGRAGRASGTLRRTEKHTVAVMLSTFKRFATLHTGCSKNRFLALWFGDVCTLPRTGNGGAANMSFWPLKQRSANAANQRDCSAGWVLSEVLCHG